MAALSGHEENAMLVSQCLDFCQTLGTSFSYSVDTMGKGGLAPQKKRKPNPSTQRQNARRREEFLKKKVNASTEKKLSSPDEPGHPLVACIIYIVYCAVFITHYTVHSYTVQCGSVDYSLHSVYYTVYTV